MLYSTVRSPRGSRRGVSNSCPIRPVQPGRFSLTHFSNLLVNRLLAHGPRYRFPNPRGRERFQSSPRDTPLSGDPRPLHTAAPHWAICFNISGTPAPIAYGSTPSSSQPPIRACPAPSHTAAPLLHPSRPYGLAPSHRIRQHPGCNRVSTVPALTHSPTPATRATDLGALRAIPPTTPPLPSPPENPPPTLVPPLPPSPPPAPRAPDLGALRAIPPTPPPLPSRRENPPPTVVPATRSLTAAQPAQLRAPARRGRCRAQESRGPHPKRRRDAPPPAVRE